MKRMRKSKAIDKNVDEEWKKNVLNYKNRGMKN